MLSNLIGKVQQRREKPVKLRIDQGRTNFLPVFKVSRLMAHNAKYGGS